MYKTLGMDGVEVGELRVLHPFDGRFDEDATIVPNVESYTIHKDGRLTVHVASGEDLQFALEDWIDAEFLVSEDDDDYE